MNLLNKHNVSPVIAADGDWQEKQKQKQKVKNEITENITGANNMTSFGTEKTPELTTIHSNMKQDKKEMAMFNQKGPRKADEDLSITERVQRQMNYCCKKMAVKGGRCKHCPDGKKRKRPSDCCLIVPVCHHMRPRPEEGQVKYKNMDKKGSESKRNTLSLRNQAKMNQATNGETSAPGKSPIHLLDQPNGRIPSLMEGPLIIKTKGKNKELNKKQKTNTNYCREEDEHQPTLSNVNSNPLTSFSSQESKFYNNNSNSSNKICNNDKMANKSSKKSTSMSFIRKQSVTRNQNRVTKKASKCNQKISYLVCNCRGYSSKKNAIRAILDANEYKFVMMTETHLYEGKKPNHPNYTFVGRSRKKINSKGGIAIGYPKEIADQVIKVREGTGNNEFILLKYTGVSPPLIVGVVYGNQENTTPDDTIRENLAELFAAINEYKTQGCKILIGGDFNVHVGEVIERNEPKVSKGGKILTELMNDFDLDFANKLEKGQNHTHFDVSAGTSRILDYVITDLVEEHKTFKVDNEKEATPYIMKCKRENGTLKWDNVYTDHLSMIGEIEIESIRKMFFAY